MPAIDPERLKKQVDSLLDVVGDPVELQRGCIELLDFYADRTQKSIATREADETYRAFGAPKPLMRALIFGLRARLEERPTLSFPAAAALWEAGYRETRVLASAILGDLNGEDVPSRAETWALECDDQIALRELANQGLASSWSTACSPTGDCCCFPELPGAGSAGFLGAPASCRLGAGETPALPTLFPKPCLGT